MPQIPQENLGTPIFTEIQQHLTTPPKLRRSLDTNPTWKLSELLRGCLTLLELDKNWCALTFWLKVPVEFEAFYQNKFGLA